jgi:hypothetical protein
MEKFKACRESTKQTHNKALQLEYLKIKSITYHHQTPNLIIYMHECETKTKNVFLQIFNQVYS